jgi:hypothetical protein
MTKLMVILFFVLSFSFSMDSFAQAQRRQFGIGLQFEEEELEQPLEMGLLVAEADLEKRKSLETFVESIENLLSTEGSLDQIQVDSPLLNSKIYQLSILLEKLLIRKINVNVKNELGQTPLVLAIEAGQLEVVRIFLKYGADIHLKDLTGQSPIMVALKHSASNTFNLRKNRLNIVKELVRYGVDPNREDQDGLDTVQFLKKLCEEYETDFHLAYEIPSLKAVARFMVNYTYRKRELLDMVLPSHDGSMMIPLPLNVVDLIMSFPEASEGEYLFPEREISVPESVQSMEAENRS